MGNEKRKVMGKTKELLESQSWFEYANRAELHWMEQEYFNYTIINDRDEQDD